MSKPLPRQPEANIGVIGHVDHGKTTLVQALTGVWTSRHSEELKRGISIRIGYADLGIWKCESCPPPECYATKETCPACGSETSFQRAISFVDCPGHEALMTTMLAGTSVMDGAVLVIAADEPVPQPQTREHFRAAEMIGIEHFVIAHNKIDIVPKDQILESYKQILAFLKGTIAEGAPIIPVSAQHGVNMDVLLEAFEKYLPTPKRDPSKPPRMYILRSFDVNRPGTPPEKMVGGVLGGSILQGEFSVGDEIEIVPGLFDKVKRTYTPLRTEIVSLHAGGRQVERATCGGLVGIGTKLDPALTKADGLVGNVVGKAGMVPEPVQELSLEAKLFDRVVGLRECVEVKPIEVNEKLVLCIGTTLTLATATSVRGETIEVTLSKPVCAEPGMRAAISRSIGGRWRLIGCGLVLS